MKKIFVYSRREEAANYIASIASCGAEAVCSRELAMSSGCSALILMGGGDPDPALYGETVAGSRNILRERDAAELWLIKAFFATGRPILGICRGIQLLSIAFGGSLYQDIASVSRHGYDKLRGDKIHIVLAGEKSFLSPLYGHRFRVNSAHHQAVKKLPAGFIVSALSEDGIIEAAQHTGNRIFAVQFHPERMFSNEKNIGVADGKKIFQKFVEIIP